MFGCTAVQAQIMVVEMQFNMILNKVRLEQPSTQLDGFSSRVILGASAACTTSWQMRRNSNRRRARGNILVRRKD